MNRLNSYTILLVGCYYILYTNFSFLVAHYMKTAPPSVKISSKAQLGLRRIVLTNAWRVEKAYFSSHSTEPKRTGRWKVWAEAPGIGLGG